MNAGLEEGCIFDGMVKRPIPIFRKMGKQTLSGLMTIYESQTELTQQIPDQWRRFRSRHPELRSNASLYGASPCTSDQKIHYLTGVACESLEDGIQEEALALHSGEYAVVQVDDATLLRDTWTWLLETWLPASGRQEKRAPEFERYSGISESGLPIAPIEIWIPLESLSTASQ